jgi:hypothetical protein
MTSSNKIVIGIGTACLDQLLLWRDLGGPVVGDGVEKHAL